METEVREHQQLSEFASFSDKSRGREREEEKCLIRTEFQRDRDRIIHSKAFRRLKHKTQVFLSPSGDHYRTRLTHTLEVSQIARTIARALRLNEDLAEAIALGHDLGHTPFGHKGEYVLNDICEGGFRHTEQSLRVVEVLEPMNLTWEVRDGILHHSGEEISATPEGRIVRFADKIAYLNHDIDDAIRAGVLKPQELPYDCINILGDSHSKRITTLISAIIEESTGCPDVIMRSDVLDAMVMLRKFMFDKVYFNPSAKPEEDKVHNLMLGLYSHYVVLKGPVEAKDYVAGMTDDFAIKKYQEIFIPKSWQGIKEK